MVESPVGFLRLRKPVQLASKVPQELVEVIKKDKQIIDWSEQYSALCGKLPNDSEILRFALCVFAFSKLTTKTNDHEYIQKKEVA